jgi:DNA-binding NarL/FixJ family response regulator
MIKILLADDHAIVCEGFRSLLKEEPGMEVIAEADNGRKAVELAKKMQPDLVVMDISMPDLNGIEATRRIMRDNPSAKIISLSMHNDKRYITEMLKAGARGYLLKKGAFQELVAAIRAVMNGRIYLSPDITGIVVEDYLKNFPEADSSTRSLLTERELEILQLVAEGKSMKEIAFLLELSVKTVSNHRQNIMEKLKIDSLASLVKYAIREGFSSLEG